MLPPPIPFDEDARLDALRALSILDTEPEERFERLTRLAQRVFDVPIALVSLVDRDRQWHKAKAGLDVRELPRSLSFCGHALFSDGLFVVENALEDPRFANNPFVLGEPHVRFYAGHLLRAPSGHKLGTLCIIDRRTRQLSGQDIGLLRDMSRIVESEIAAVHMAVTDHLTGLANRRGFEHQAQRMLALCRRDTVPVTLLYFDLDGFKVINDRHGHAAGDHVLETFAGLLTQTFRASDLCARLGGDEFVVMQCTRRPAAAAASLSRLQRAVDGFNASSGLGLPLAFSVGRIEAESLGATDVAGLLAEGDRRMYVRKRART